MQSINQQRKSIYVNLMLEDVQHLAGGLNQIRMEFWKNLKQFWMPAEKRGEEDMENKLEIENEVRRQIFSDLMELERETDHYISREILAIVAGYKIPLKKKKEGEKDD